MHGRWRGKFGMKELSTIACIEDDPDIRTILGLALSDLGQFDVVMYSSGYEALARLGAQKPQLVMMDLMMPNMDGLETMQHMQRDDELSRIPVIFMTAKAHPDEVRRLKAAGAREVLVKPFDPMTLAGDLRRIWTRVH